MSEFRTALSCGDRQSRQSGVLRALSAVEMPSSNPPKIEIFALAAAGPKNLGERIGLVFVNSFITTDKIVLRFVKMAVGML